MVSRLEGAFESATVSSKDVACVVSIGVNDARWVDEVGSPQTSDETYEETLREIFTHIKQYTDRILVPGLTTINDSTSLRFKNFIYDKERIAAYDKILQKVATESGAVYVEVASKLQGKPELFFRDNLHLNDAGHELLAQLVLPELEKILHP